MIIPLPPIRHHILHVVLNLLFLVGYVKYLAWAGTADVGRGLTKHIRYGVLVHVGKSRGVSICCFAAQVEEDALLFRRWRRQV